MSDDHEARELGRLVGQNRVGMSFANARINERVSRLPPAQRKEARKDLQREVVKGVRDAGGTIIRDD